MYNEINKTQNKNGKITKIILILTIILLIMISLFLTYKILTKNKTLKTLNKAAIKNEI